LLIDRNEEIITGVRIGKIIEKATNGVIRLLSNRLSLGDLIDLVDSDEVIGETGVELVVRLVPGERSARDVLGGLDLGGVSSGLESGELVGEHGGLLDLLDVLGGGEVEHLDTIFTSDDDPVEFLGEEDAVDGGVVLVRGEPFTLDNIPDHDLTVVRSGSEVGGVVDHVDGVNLGLVSHEGVHELHVGVVPDLDGLIPRGGDADGGLGLVVESNARDGISVGVLVNGMFADTVDVPDFDLVIASTGENLVLVGGEGNGEDISGVTDELVDGLSRLEVPKSAGTVPRGGEAMVAVTGEADLVDEVRVTGVHAGGLTPLSVFLVVVLVIESPLDEGSVTRSRDEEFNLLSVTLFFSDSEGGDPTSMSLKVTLLGESVLSLLYVFDHCDVV
jgi:hypothetical protein